MTAQLSAPETVFAEALRAAAMAPGAERAAERLLVEDFAVLAEAASSPQRLRLLILTLAVTGRLSQPLPTDGDVPAMLAKLRGENVPNAAKVRAAVQEDVTGPATIPEAWRWAEFPLVASIDSHLVDPAEFMDSPHVAPDNIEKGTGRLLEYRTIREDGVTSTKHRFFAGQIVYSKIRPNLSKAVLVDFEGLCSADMYPLTARIDRRFFHCFLLSPVFLVQVVKGDNRLAMPKVNQEQLGATVVPVPPLAEQKRIVARVDQLMALIDDLEARQTKKRDLSTRFTQASLEALTTADSREAFDTAWQRVLENFATLSDGSHKVIELRKAIFGVACRGALTARGAGSGRTVIERTSQRRRECVSQETEVASREAARHQRKLTGQADSIGEIRLPENWTWASLLACCSQLVDCHNKTAPYTSEGVALVRTSNIRDGKVKLDGAMRVSEATYQHWSRRCPPEPGDLVFTREAPMGEVGLVEPGMRICMGQRMMLLRTFPDLIEPQFLVLALRDPAFQRRMIRAAVGSTVKHLRVGDVEALMVPIPPFEEQKRIVAKVEHLMKICDDLEAKLRRAEDRASKLVEAVVQEMVA